jgi:hypothetical protein
MKRPAMPYPAVLIALLPMLLLLSAGCGKSKEEQQKEKLIQQAQQMQKAAEQMQTQNDNWQKKIEEHKPVPPVSFKALMEYLPTSVKGLTAEKPTGESATMGNFSFSRAEVRFGNEDGNAEVNVEIFDYAYVTALYAPFQLWLATQYRHETESGYERATQVSGCPGFERWNSNDKDGSVQLLVGERFIVKVDTRGLDEAAARNIAQTIDVGKLAGLK